MSSIKGNNFSISVQALEHLLSLFTYENSKNDIKNIIRKLKSKKFDRTIDELLHEYPSSMILNFLKASDLYHTFSLSQYNDPSYLNKFIYGDVINNLEKAEKNLKEYFKFLEKAPSEIINSLEPYESFSAFLETEDDNIIDQLSMLDNEGIQNLDDAYLDIQNKLKNHFHIKEINKKLEEALKRNNELIRHFTHDLENTIAPVLIYEVAKKILTEDVEKNRVSSALIRAYESEMMVKYHSRLVKLKLGEVDNFISELKKELYEDLPRIPFVNIIHNSLISTVGYLLFSQPERRKHILNKLFKPYRGIKDLQDSFQNEVFFSQLDNSIILKWLKDNSNNIEIYPLEIWNDLTIPEDGNMFTFLSQIIRELIFNALKYLDNDGPYLLKFELKDERLKNIDYITISISNKTSQTSSANDDGGLSMIKDDLIRLNVVDSLNGEDLQMFIDRNTFTVKFYLIKELLFRSNYENPMD